jgi:hypothetical protein
MTGTPRTSSHTSGNAAHGPTSRTRQLLGHARRIARLCARLTISGETEGRRPLKDPAFNHFWRQQIVARHHRQGELLDELLTQFLRILVAV